MKINLEKYKSSSSSIFTGRPQGIDTRKLLKLDDIDKTDEKVVFIIPSDTSSFNPSFYLGLLYQSYKNLGIEAFDKKYTFDLSNIDNETKIVIENNLEDGRRNAINSLVPDKNWLTFCSTKKRKK